MSNLAALLILALIVCFLCCLYWIEVYRRMFVEAESLRIALKYRLTHKGNDEDEHSRLDEEQLIAETERLNHAFKEALARLEGRSRFDPLRNTLINRRVFEYEVAKHKFLAAEAHGPLRISVGMMPDFMQAGEPL